MHSSLELRRFRRELHCTCMHIGGPKLALLLLPAWLLASCASLPPGSAFEKQASVALADPDQTSMGRQFDSAAQEHEGKSAFRIISVGADGFAARMQMIGTAERALDLQYFIFRGDDTGRLLTNALLAAADRGVHVRVLLDDGQTVAGDEQIVALAAHPQIEIRYFNPFAYRGHYLLLRGFEFAFHASRLDYRMHNKLIVADNATSLVGGRNVGDQYFQIDPDSQFADDDIFVAGPAVQKLSASFDAFWNSALAIPAQALAYGRPTQAALSERRTQLAAQQAKAQAAGVDYLLRAQSGEPLSGIEQGELPLVWANTQVVWDSPEKKRVQDGSMSGRLMYEPVAKVAAAVQSELIMITPYFVPTKQEMQLIVDLRQRNVQVRILTSSLAGTTELFAHSGYMHYRRQLLDAGVELYEVRPMLGSTRGSGQTAAISRAGNYGLHAKLFVFDRQKLFAGSMNFDQRSTRLNTEVGLIIDSAELAQQTAMRFDAMTQPASAYQVVLKPGSSGRQHMVWQTEEAGQTVEYTTEPSRSVWKRIVTRILWLFPLQREL